MLQQQQTDGIFDKTPKTRPKFVGDFYYKQSGDNTQQKTPAQHRRRVSVGVSCSCFIALVIWCLFNAVASLPNGYIRIFNGCRVWSEVMCSGSGVEWVGGWMGAPIFCGASPRFWKKLRVVSSGGGFALVSAVDGRLWSRPSRGSMLTLIDTPRCLLVWGIQSRKFSSLSRILVVFHEVLLLQVYIEFPLFNK